MIENGWQQILITGTYAENWQHELWKEYSSDSIINCNPEQSKIPIFKGKTKQATTTAYIFIGRTCGLPMKEISKLNTQLFD